MGDVTKLYFPILNWSITAQQIKMIIVASSLRHSDLLRFRDLRFKPGPTNLGYQYCLSDSDWNRDFNANYTISHVILGCSLSSLAALLCITLWRWCFTWKTLPIADQTIGKYLPFTATFHAVLARRFRLIFILFACFIFFLGGVYESVGEFPLLPHATHCWRCACRWMMRQMNWTENQKP